VTVNFLLVVMVTLVLGLRADGLAAAASFHDILRRADQARGNLEGITWDAKVTSRSAQSSETITLDKCARLFPGSLSLTS
jgi:hypothetical protein